MVPLHSPSEYLFHLHTTSSGEAKRMWRQNIKESWNHQCAYCGSNEELTIDHIVPQAKGGVDCTHNVLCCCKKCNHEKGHTPWEDWFYRQEFFTEERKSAIIKWMSNKQQKKALYTYSRRLNKVF